MVVREKNGTRKRRHKDDVKPYYKSLVSHSPLDDGNEEEDELNNAPSAPLQEATDTGEVHDPEPEVEEEPAQHQMPLRPQRQRTAPERYGEWVTHRVQGAKVRDCCCDLISFV